MNFFIMDSGVTCLAPGAEIRENPKKRAETIINYGFLG